jgi:hypothetical protein
MAALLSVRAQSTEQRVVIRGGAAESIVVAGGPVESPPVYWAAR